MALLPLKWGFAIYTLPPRARRLRPLVNLRQVFMVRFKLFLRRLVSFATMVLSVRLTAEKTKKRMNYDGKACQY